MKPTCYGMERGVGPAHESPSQISRSGVRVLAGALLLLAGLPGFAWSADYFVDFGATVRTTCTGGAGSCSDACPGTAQVQSGSNGPWCRLPGTRMTNDSGWIAPAWGSFTQSNQIPAGTTIWIKGGTTHNSSRGGRIIIGRCTTPDCPGGGEGFYGNGTPSSHIEIRNGAAFGTPWGSGHVTFDCAGMSGYQYDACVSVIDENTSRANWVWLRGKDASNRLRIINSPISGFTGYTDNYGGAGILTGLVLQHMEVADSGNFGITISHADSVTVANVSVHGSGSSGIAFGDGPSAAPRTVRDGTVVDAEVYGNGTNTGGDRQHGFNCFDCGTAAQAVVNLRGKTHNNNRDGADNGLLSDSGSGWILYLDLETYDNGEDGLACNGSPACSGCSFTCSAVGMRDFNNANSGTCAYEDGTHQYVSNSVVHAANGCHFLSGTVDVNVQNVICYRPQTSSAWGSCGGATGTVTRRARNSVWIPRTSDSDRFIGSINYDGNPSGSFAVWSGNKLGISSPNNDSPQLFTAVSDTTYAASDYHPSGPGTAAIDAGEPYCRVTSASGAGSSFTVNCDPRLFFFVSTNRPLIPADAAFIGTADRKCTITGLTANTVTCSSPVTWSQNDAVARNPVAGTAIDIGPFEYNGAGTALRPPTLLDVEPLP